jgi:hypothetical protein
MEPRAASALRRSASIEDEAEDAFEAAGLAADLEADALEVPLEAAPFEATEAERGSGGVGRTRDGDEGEVRKNGESVMAITSATPKNGRGDAYSRNMASPHEKNR